MRKYHRIARLIEMVTMIRTDRHLRPRDLADHFGVSEKRIFDDITDLNMAGVPIVFADSGYQILPTFFLPPPQLTDEEALALLMGAALLQQSPGGPDRETIQSAIRKISAAPSPADLDRMVRLKESIHVSHAAGETIRPGVLKRLSDCISDRRRVSLFYNLLPEGRIQECLVDACSIAYLHGEWRLVGYYHEAKEVKSFILKRILRVKPLSEHFTIDYVWDAEVRDAGCPGEVGAGK